MLANEQHPGAATCRASAVQSRARIARVAGDAWAANACAVARTPNPVRIPAYLRHATRAANAIAVQSSFCWAQAEPHAVVPLRGRRYRKEIARLSFQIICPGLQPLASGDRLNPSLWPLAQHSHRGSSVSGSCEPRSEPQTHALRCTAARTAPRCSYPGAPQRTRAGT